MLAGPRTLPPGVGAARAARSGLATDLGRA